LAMNTAVERAREFGVAMTFVRNTNNIGFLSNYPMMAAAQDMIGICACNAASSISLWGGMEPVLGSNPISLAFPTDGDYPLVMDLSVSNVARGKIREADRLGKKIPPTWAFGPDGKPTEDPAKALKGVLMPIGGPKGVALAIAVDILAGVISGSKYSKDVKTFHKLTGETGVGAFFIAIDPKEFIAPSLLKKLLGEYIVKIKNIEKAEKVDQLYLPGEIENHKETVSRAEGLELEDGPVEMLNTMLAEVGSELRLG
jgi:LDH2 family malate/lactate/ureidoglycolate dehydrogenase